MHDLVIRGGTLVDGTGGAPFVGDLAIDGNRITAVGVVPAKGRQEIDARGVSLDLENMPPDLPVNINPLRLSRVFYNLINNAIDEMPEGGGILLRFAFTEREIRIEVEDTGKGIAPEIAQQLFEPFATHGKVHGTGLGLSICKKIIEDHGGRIWARSDPNRGATFCFTLPVAA